MIRNYLAEVSGRRPGGEFEDPFVVLGLDAGASEADVAEARRRLAKALHPDVGGPIEAMQRVNAAAERALCILHDRSSMPAAGPPWPAAPAARTPTGGRTWSGARDHPSFTVEALPVEAFEALVIVAGWLGDVIVDDPPYLLEVALVDPVRGWCRLDLVPDAGASTVSLTVAAEPGLAMPGVEVVRDLWIDGLNRLDWTELDGSR